MITEDRKQFYIDLIKTSSSLREVCLKSGIVATTGNYNTLKRIIKENDIDITHFKRQNGNKKAPQDIEFYLSKNSTISSYKLKNKLLKKGIKEKKCENCGLTEWMGKPLKLELHHINGDNTDNRIENLQILCPNCHSYTDNYGGKNQKINIKEKNEITKTRSLVDLDLLQNLLNEGISIDDIAKTMCVTRGTILKHIRKNNLLITQKPKEPSYNIDEMILLMKKHKNYSKVGSILGVTDNAIKKRFVSLGYPNNIKELIASL